MLGMLDNWQSFAKRLSHDYMVIMLDLRNHGRSSHDRLMTYDLMAFDVQQFMEQNWLYEGAVVMGHSMGGKVAMQLAAVHPELVKKLTVVDMAPSDYEPAYWGLFNALQGIVLEDIDRRGEVLEQLMEKLGDEAVVGFLAKNLARNRDGSFFWRMNLPAIISNYELLLKAPPFPKTLVEVPTLFIKGANSSYIQQEQINHIDQKFSTYEIVEIQDAGHWVHADNPDELEKTVVSWFKP
ncbi:MAG: alpha/beta fold hydrolase [Saprospiraceae bacterium]|nr:alpha/beta fold hydrolase [Saprospiraceae bacterium]